MPAGSAEFSERGQVAMSDGRRNHDVDEEGAGGFFGAAHAYAMKTLDANPPRTVTLQIGRD